MMRARSTSDWSQSNNISCDVWLDELCVQYSMRLSNGTAAEGEPEGKPGNTTTPSAEDESESEADPTPSPSPEPGNEPEPESK